MNATDIYGNTPLHLAMGKLPEEDRGLEVIYFVLNIYRGDLVRVHIIILNHNLLKLFWW